MYTVVFPCSWVRFYLDGAMLLFMYMPLPDCYVVPLLQSALAWRRERGRCPRLVVEPCRNERLEACWRITHSAWFRAGGGF